MFASLVEIYQCLLIYQATNGLTTGRRPFLPHTHTFEKTIQNRHMEGVPNSFSSLQLFWFSTYTHAALQTQWQIPNHKVKVQVISHVLYIGPKIKTK